MADESKNTIETEISAFVSPKADAAFKSFSDRVDRLNQQSAALDKRFGSVNGSSYRMARSVDRASRSMTGLARGASASNQEGRRGVQVNDRLTRTTDGVTGATRRSAAATTQATRARSEYTRAVEAQRREEERLNRIMDGSKGGRDNKGRFLPGAGGGSGGGGNRGNGLGSGNRDNSFNARRERRNAFGENASSFGNRAGMTAGGAAVGIGAIVAKGMQLDKTLTYIGITAGANDGELKQMAARVRATSDLAVQSSSDVAAALSGVVASNVGNLGNALDISEAAAHAATAADATVEDMASTYVAAFKQMGVSIKDIVNNRAGDVMAAAGKAGNFELKDMAQYFPSILANAKGMGAKGLGGLAQVSAQMQIMMNGAGSASEAATNWMNVFPKLQSAEALKNLKDKFNIDLEPIVKATKAQGGDVALAMAEAIQKATKGDMFRLKEISSDMQFGTALFTFIDGLDQYKKIVAEASSATGVIAADEKKVLESRFIAVKRLTNDLEHLSQDLAILFAPAVSKVASVVNFGARALTSFTETFPNLSSFAGGATVAIVGLVAITAVVAKTVGITIKAFSSLTRAIRIMNVAAYRASRTRGGLGGGSGGSGPRGRRGRGGRGLGGLIGGLIGGGWDLAGDAWDYMSGTRPGQAVGRAGRGAWGAARGAVGRGMGWLGRGVGAARGLMGLGAAGGGAGLGASVAGAGAATAGGVAVAGTALGMGIAEAIQWGTEKATGQTLSEHIGNELTTEQPMWKRIAAGIITVGMSEAAYGLSSGIRNEKIANEADNARLRAEHEAKLKAKDAVTKSAQAAGAGKAGGNAGTTFYDNSNITIEIKGGPAMTTAEMAQATAEAIAKATRNARFDENKLVRGAYSDGVATKG